MRAREAGERAAGESAAAKAGVPVEGDTDGGEGAYQFVTVRDGRVYVRATRNVNAAISTGANLVRQTPPYNFDGTGLTLGVWDAQSVRATHQEFVGRLTLKNLVAAHTHSTHVGGTVAASGVNAAAKGMAPAAKLDSYDWNSDAAEMIAAAMATPGQAGKIQLSNHSYGFQAGWSSTTWYGTWGNRESDSFGMYDGFAAELDAICHNAPYYLPFRAAGNDRIDGAPSAGALFTYFDNDGSHSKAYDPALDPRSDNWDGGGYDTISLEANAKNVITIGAVNDAVSNGARSLPDATMSAFSSWGPTDDGRVKPDLMANGVGLFSTTSTGDAAYGNSSGTSMASPNAMGSAALLLQHFGRLFPGAYMRASMIKGLLIHTAVDLGTAGPDYQNGWGLMDTLAAVQHLDAHAAFTNAVRMAEGSISSALPSRTYRVLWNRSTPIRATLCWTDPPGFARSVLDDRASVLVNDLDLRVVSPSGVTNFPFTLSVTNPASPAVPADNWLDNVEQVYLAAPGEPGEYEVRVTHKGVLTGSAQVFALLVSGGTEVPAISHDPLQNTTNTVMPYVVTAAVTSESGLDPASLWLHWNTTGSGGPFATAPLVLVSNNVYRAEVPPQPEGTTIYYHLEAASTNGLVGHSPANAPDDVHAFTIVRALTLFVSGQPVHVPGVSPGYGFSQYPSGVTVHVEAPLYSAPVAGVRDLCAGWVACCSIPASGKTNVLDFTIRDDVFLAWQWVKAYELSQSANLPGVLTAATWWAQGSTGETVTAAQAVAQGGADHRFVGWFVDGARLPDDTSRASNPGAGIAMTQPHVAEARYMNAALDADLDGVPDWWERYYFGGTNSILNLDSDGDGFSNRKEFEDGSDPRDDASTPMPPAIAHVPLAAAQGRPAPWAVSAQVTDNTAVARVQLEWRRNAGAWQSATLAVSQVSGVYTGAIPAPGVTGDQVLYRFNARDTAGFQAVNGPYALDVAYPVASLNPPDFGTLLLPAGGSLRTVLSVGNAGHAPLTWSLHPLPIGLQDHAEAGTNGWTHGGAQDGWHLASWRAYSGSNAWYLGNDGSRQYSDSTTAWLMSPPVVLGSNAVFGFQQWLSTEALKDATHAWDGGFVEISTNHGETFSQIVPVGGYPYVIFGHSAAPFPDGTPCLAGTGGWQQVAFDLAAYVGQTVRLRLVFGSDGFVVNEGWYVDDLHVTPYGGSPDWIQAAESGSVSMQDSTMLQVNVSAVPLQPGEMRQARMFLESNDPIVPNHQSRIALQNTSRTVLVQVTGPGAVTPPGPVVVSPGAGVNFAVAAGEFHHIDDLRTNGVSLAVGFGMATTNYLWTNVNFAGTGMLHAVFAANMTTSGVPEPWLAAFGLTNGDAEAEAQADQDGDLLASWGEYVAGTDPTNPVSRFMVMGLEPYGPVSNVAPSGVVMVVEGHVLEWNSVSGRVYTLFSATNPVADYVVISPDIAATPPRNRLTNSLPLGGGNYYRLGVELAE